MNWMAGLADWQLWLLVPAAIAVLAVGADRLVTGAAKFAATVGLPTVVIGATVVSLGTTSPEVAVSVTAAIGGAGDVALGNGVGSIICDTGLIFGLLLVFGRPKVDRFILRRQGVLQLAAGGLLAATVFALALLGGGADGIVLPRAVGAVFVALLAGYMYVSVRWSRAHPQMVPDEARVQVDRQRRLRTGLWDLVLLGAGLALVIVGSKFMIGSVDQLARRHGVPQDIMAVTLVAFGTSLPELVTVIAAMAKGHGALAVGNIIGADILNVLAVIGLSATAVPLHVAPAFLSLHLPAMLVVLGIMGAYTFCNKTRYHRWQGIPLLAAYAGYYVVLLWRFGPSAAL